MQSRSVIPTPRAVRGKTVGRAVIKSFIHDYLHSQDADFKPLYTQARFNAMVEGIQSEHEYNIYLQYVAVHNGLSEELVRAQAYAQQAQHAMAHIHATTSGLLRAADQQSLLARLLALYGLPLDPDEAAALQAALHDLLPNPAFLAANPHEAENIRLYFTQLLFPALRGLAAYTSLLAILADALAFPDVQRLAVPTDDIDRDIALYNKDLSRVLAAWPGTLLDALLLPIHAEAYTPDTQAIQDIKKLLEAPDALQAGIVQQLFMQLLEHTP